MRVVRGRAVHGEIGQDLADTRAELVAVPGEACSDNDIAVLGQHIQDEMLVRRVHEHAGLEADRLPHRACKIAAEPGQDILILGRDVPVDGVGVDVLPAVAELADLEAFACLLGKAIEIAPSPDSRG